MKKNLKFLVSSSLIALTFLIPPKTHGMENHPLLEDQSPSVSPKPLHTSHTKSESLEDFLKNTPSLYHQVSTERYRSSVGTLRQEILTLQERIVSFDTSSEISIVVQNEIKTLEEAILVRREASNKYGADQGLAQQKISKEIEELRDTKTMNQRNIINSPVLKGLYEVQTIDMDARLKTCENYLASLEKSETTLQSTLEIAKRYLRTLGEQATSAEQLKNTMSQNVKYLQDLYESHVNGLGGTEVFPHHLPRVILECLGISSAQLNHVPTKHLFQLFARTMELPYISSVQTGEEKEKAYFDQLNIIKQDLINRLQEDVFSLQMIASIANEGDIEINLQDHNAKAEKLLLKVGLGETINKDRELENLQEVLSSYGYKKDTLSKFLESILTQSSYGLLGLYIASLEFYPVSSWNNSAQVSIYGRVPHLKSEKDFSESMVENVCVILGRHINMQVLEKIAEKLQENREILPSPKSDWVRELYI